MALGFTTEPQYHAVALLLPAVQAAREAARSSVNQVDLGLGTVETLVRRATQGGGGGKLQSLTIYGSAPGDPPSRPPIADFSIINRLSKSTSLLSRALDQTAEGTIRLVGFGLAGDPRSRSEIATLAKRCAATVECVEPATHQGYSVTRHGQYRPTTEGAGAG